jgi:AmmeMemoRadiSam system protein B
MNPNKIRPTAVAGMFYPSDPQELLREVSGYLSASEPDENLHAKDIKAIIAPHAGYIYSGPVAASAYRYLDQLKSQVSNVILIGPSHRVPLLGLATSSADYFNTPLGNIPINRDITDELNSLPFVTELDQAHMMEHSLEVHLPFLQLTLGEFQLVPIVAGDASPDEVDQLITKALHHKKTLLVISSDLSHYHDYQTAQKLDSDTCHAIETLSINELDSQHACGYIPVRGLLKYARENGLTAKTVDCRNSGDTAGPRNEVVGYGAYVFT